MPRSRRTRTDDALFQHITDPKKRAFLAAFAHVGQVTRAAKSAKVIWRNHYNWLKHDPVYADAFQEAVRMAGDFLEDAAVRRAHAGSDVLLIFLLKGAKPEKYRERHEHMGQDGGAMVLRVVYDSPPPETE